MLALCARLDGAPGSAAYAQGRAVFEAPAEVVEVVPPFGLAHEGEYDRVETGPLRAHLERPRVVGLVAVRLGGYAAAVYRDEKLVAGRAGTRFVKGRNRKGGSSSGRFARRRGEQSRDLHERAAALADELLAPYASDLDHLVLAGDRLALRAVAERSTLLRRLGQVSEPAPFPIGDPRSSQLPALGRELWSSAVTHH